MQEFHGPLREYIVADAPRRQIMGRFRRFLDSYKIADQARPVYVAKIASMAAANKESLEVSFHDLSVSEPMLAFWTADAPTEMLRIFDEVAMQATLRNFPFYRNIHPEIHVRITNLPIVDSLRDLRYSISFHLSLILSTSLTILSVFIH